MGQTAPGQSATVQLAPVLLPTVQLGTGQRPTGQLRSPAKRARAVGEALLIVLLLTLPGCVDSGPRTPAPVKQQNGAARGTLTGSSYVVRKGDTLFSIAFRAGLDFRALAAANHVPEPYTIYPGQRLRLAVGAAASSTPPSAGRTPPAPRPAAGRQPGSPPPAVAQLRPPVFSWPARGAVVRGFGGGNKGLDIGGRVGDPVYAAADGVVVYAGNGLRGYGNLLILKHGEQFLSAYGHNERLIVREGDRIKARQQIAEIGTDGAGQVRLHFEVRREGTPVDPLAWLPAR